MASGGGDQATWNDLFGDDDNADEGVMAGKPKEKKDKKDKEKKDKKDKDQKHKKEKNDAPAEVTAKPVVETPATANKEKKDKEKEKKDGKDKDKKAKKDGKEGKEKKEKKEKKDKSSSSTAVIVPVLPIESSQPAVTEPNQNDKKEKKEKKDKKDKEKHDKKDKDKKEKKEGKDGKEHKEKKDGKEKKDKKLKKEGKEGKDRKEKKDKKRKAEDEPEKPENETALQAQADPVDAFNDVFGDKEEKPAKTTDADDGLDGIFNDFGKEVDDVFDVFNEDDQEAGANGEGQEQEGQEQDDEAEEAAQAARAAEDARKNLPIVQVPKMKRPRVAEEAQVPLTPGSSKDDKDPETDKFSVKFGNVLESIKFKKPLMINDQESQEFIKAFIQQMEDCAQGDELDRREGKPMLRKLKMLPKAIAVLQKYAFADLFVSFGGCRALAMWIKHLPGGEMPNEHLRTSILNIMARLPISKEALANCRDEPLGKVVAMMHQDKRETVVNRKVAGTLIQKWLKQVLVKKRGLDLDGLASLEDDADDTLQPKLTRPPPLTAESLKEIEAASDLRMHPAIPVVGGKEYIIKPIPRFQPIRREKVSHETNRGKLGAVLQDLSRPNKKAWKPYSVSIAGRTVNII